MISGDTKCCTLEQGQMMTNDYSAACLWVFDEALAEIRKSRDMHQISNASTFKLTTFKFPTSNFKCNNIQVPCAWNGWRSHPVILPTPVAHTMCELTMWCKKRYCMYSPHASNGFLQGLALGRAWKKHLKMTPQKSHLRIKNHDLSGTLPGHETPTEASDTRLHQGFGASDPIRIQLVDISREVASPWKSKGCSVLRYDMLHDTMLCLLPRLESHKSWNSLPQTVPPALG